MSDTDRLDRGKRALAETCYMGRNALLLLTGQVPAAMTDQLDEALAGLLDLWHDVWGVQPCDTESMT